MTYLKHTWQLGNSKTISTEQKTQTFIDIQQQHTNFFDQPIFLIHPEEIKKRYFYLQRFLPTCKIHYAVKCCPQEALIQTLKTAGCHFEVASEGELNDLTAQGIPSNEVIHTHPMKRKSEIAACIQKGMKHFVVDSIDELIKFEPYTFDVELMVRIAFSNAEAKINLSEKFGLALEEAFDFICEARLQGYPVTGICFHAGSQLMTNQQHLIALAQCAQLHERLKSEGIQLNRLDIGGGFPFYFGQTELDIQEYLAPINAFLETHFSDVECIAEPGRFLASSAATLVCKVIGRRRKNNRWEYHLNDGVYGCLSALKHDLGEFLLEHNMHFHPKNNNTWSTATFYGPTCDSMDKITTTEAPELQVDDLVLFRNLGAYSIASACNFNQVSSPRIIVN